MIEIRQPSYSSKEMYPNVSSLPMFLDLITAFGAVRAGITRKGWIDLMTQLQIWLFGYTQSLPRSLKIPPASFEIPSKGKNSPSRKTSQWF